MHTHNTIFFFPFTENIKNLKVNCDSLAFAKSRKDSKFKTLMMQLDYTLKDRQMAAEE